MSLGRGGESTSAYGNSQARGQIEAAGAGLHHSHSNMDSALHLRPTPQLTTKPDPSPLSEARDQTQILMDTGWVCHCWAMTGTPKDVSLRGQITAVYCVKSSDFTPLLEPQRSQGITRLLRVYGRWIWGSGRAWGRYYCGPGERRCERELGQGELEQGGQIWKIVKKDNVRYSFYESWWGWPSSLWSDWLGDL